MSEMARTTQLFSQFEAPSARRTTILPASMHDNSRLHGLDALRGLAALAVVVFHWHVLFFDGDWASNHFIRSSQPGFEFLRLIYQQGWMAVDLFFVLSGFIFYRLYARPIADGDVTGRQFFVLRFSRLYPLFFISLIVVAIEQSVSASMFGHAVGPYMNDGYHFVLNLFMASSWGFEFGHSFNVPSWSVSVEAAMYAVFFMVAKYLPARWWVAAAMVLAGLALTPEHWWIGRGLVGFFVGGLTCLVHEQIVRRAVQGAAASAAAVLIATGCALAYGVSTRTEVMVLTLFAPAVLLIAMSESALRAVWSRLAFLGDISYSVYLLHFPMLLALAIGGRAAGWPLQTFYSWHVMFAFFAVLIAIATISFRYFERPAQQILRTRFARSAASGSA